MNFEDMPQEVRDKMQADKFLYGTGFCIRENGKYTYIEASKVKIKENGEWEINDE